MAIQSLTKKANKFLWSLDIIELYKGILNGTWERFPDGYWEGEDKFDRANIIIRYLILEHLKCGEEEAFQYASNESMQKYKLMGLIGVCYRGKVITAFLNAFPNIKPWTLDKKPANYWNNERAICATKWLIEEVLQWNRENIINRMRSDVFREYGLQWMLYEIYGGSPTKAVIACYPGKFKTSDFKTVPRDHYLMESNIVKDILKISTRINKPVEIILMDDLANNGGTGIRQRIVKRPASSNKDLNYYKTLAIQERDSKNNDI